jgi:hypothetical protein
VSAQGARPTHIDYLREPRRFEKRSTRCRTNFGIITSGSHARRTSQPAAMIETMTGKWEVNVMGRL